MFVRITGNKTTGLLQEGGWTNPTTSTFALFLSSPYVPLSLMPHTPSQLKNRTWIKVFPYPTTMPGCEVVSVLGNANAHANSSSNEFPCGALSSALSSALSCPGMTALPTSHSKRRWCLSLHHSTKISWTPCSPSCLLQRIRPETLGSSFKEKQRHWSGRWSSFM